MSQNRAEIIEQNFLRWVQDGNLPESFTDVTLHDADLSPSKFVDIFESQLISRRMDLLARQLRTRHASFYTIGSSGHEGNAAYAEAFRLDDMAFLHYRSGGFFIQRSKQLPGSTPLYDMLLSFMASADEPISRGRHKVFGSVPLLVPPQTSTIASHLPKAMGAALSIGRAKDLNISGPMSHDSVVLCSFGDASANHATALAAFNTAAWCSYQQLPMPLVFICEDNGIGISVNTPGGWIERSFGNRPGFRYFYCDGASIPDVYLTSREAADYARRTRRPVFLHIKTVRLMGHAGSDVEMTYRPMAEIEATERQDPILHSARIALQEGLLSVDEIMAIHRQIRERCERIAEEVIPRPKLVTREAIAASVLPRPRDVAVRPTPSPEARERLFGHKMKMMQGRHHMARLINWALADLMLQYPEIVMFGEDVAKKGGVYNVTSGLFEMYGQKRVFNSPLDETSILGAAIGMAHNGFLPIPEIQFLAYVHNAEDQLRGEASTLSFFSDGQYSNPMVVRVAGLAYQKGFGGHFHNDNSVAVFRDLPGVILACPANGADAVRMLRTCVREAYERGRVVVFLEPIALYMTKDLLTDGDTEWSFEYPAAGEEIPLGEIGIHGDSEQLAIITYGNGAYLSMQARRILEQEHGIQVKVVDLRWLAPLNVPAMLDAVRDCANVIVVDECRRTGSQSEAICTALLEGLPQLPRIKRIAAEDCFIPLGVGATVPLPSRDEIVAEAIRLVSRKTDGKAVPLGVRHS